MLDNDLRITGPDLKRALRRADVVITAFAERLDTSRGSPGYGLGLSLVRGIAELHSGSARLSEGKSGGTCALMEIPLRA